MKRISLLTCLCLLLLMHLPVRTVQADTRLWYSVASGVDYREFYLRTPNRVYVARLDRENPLAILESSISQGYLNKGSETVSQMAQRNDQVVHYWDEAWGNRSQVVVAINGFFFDSETGFPWQGQVVSGWYAKRFDDRQSGSGLAWTMGRDIFIGGCVTHPPAKQFLTFLTNGKEQVFDGINTSRGENELVLYTPQYDLTTPASSEGIDILVELSRPMMIIPTPGMITGTVQAIYDPGGATQIPFDHIVLSASGKAAEKIRPSVQVGDPVGISQEIKHYASNCNTPAKSGWEKTYTAIGASFPFLQNGEIYGFDDLGALLRSPRTAVAYNDRYIFFIVVDGRDRFQSVGLSIVELAVFAKNQLGATWGAALDGGGSSTMVVNGQVVNKPNIEYISTDSASKLQETITERVVGNGLMMALVHPKQVSTAFQAGNAIKTLSEVGLRSGPGNNFGIVVTIGANAEGNIIQHTNGLNGVFATGAYWWKVNIGNAVGWIPEDALLAISTP